MKMVLGYGKKLLDAYMVTIGVTVVGTFFGLFVMSMFAYAISREDYRAAKGDLSRLNMYTTTMSMKIWVYTSLGQFVDYFTFTQEMDDPDLVSDAGVLKLYFEQKPDKDGNLWV